MPSVISRVARSQPAAAATFPPAPPVTDRPTSSRRTPRRPRGRTVAIVATLSLLPNRMTRSRDMTAPRLGSRRISARRRQCPRQPTFFENGRAGIGGCHAARVLVRAPGDEIGDEERQRNLERDEQRERGEQDRGRLPDGQLARVGARRGQLPRAREQRVREDAWRQRRLEQVAGRGPGGGDERPAAVRTRRSTCGAPSASTRACSATTSSPLSSTTASTSCTSSSPRLPSTQRDGGRLARLAEPRLLDSDGRWLLGRVGKWMTVVKNAASRLCWSRVGVLVARRLGI